jgi:SAM-dependent methyltransferase
MNFRSRWTLFIAALAFAFTFNHVSDAEAKRVLITQKIQESNLVALTGNTRPDANKKNDRGAVADDLPLDHLMLQLRRPNELETALEQYIGQLHDPKSQNFHKWLTAAQVGATYGLAQGDLDTLTSWLRSQGFKVNEVYPTGTVIDFSGTAAEVEASFHTKIHNLDVNGVHQIANMSDPRIPAALASAVVGVVKLNSFMPHPMIKKMTTPMNPAAGRRPSTDYTTGSGYYAVVPSDLATIYNLNPAFAAGYTGLGRTIALIEDTDVYNYPGDWNAFRSTFGLSQQFPSGTFVQVHPGANCSDPGINGDEVEAALDVEWSSAAAPNAAIELAFCFDTATNFGGFIALEGQGKVAKVIGIDIDPNARLNPTINEFRIPAGERWPVEDRSANLIVCDYVIEHLRDPETLFSEAQRVLMPRGYLCIRTTNRLSYIGVAAKVVPNTHHARVLSRIPTRAKSLRCFSAPLPMQHGSRHSS